MKQRYIFRTTIQERLTLILLAIIIAIGSGFVISRTPAVEQTVRINRTAYIPPGSIYGLTGVNSIISSPYYYESSLVNYSVPVADSDYILGYGRTERVHLPGYGNDRYRFIRTGYISGSGWFETWQTPNGGYIAFIHLSQVYISAERRLKAKDQKINTANQSTCNFFKGNKYTSFFYNENCLNGDHTGLVANQLIGQQLVFASNSTHTGGYSIGVSGWPTDPIYGNGVAGPVNAHLCMVYDQAGANWLNYVTYQAKPKPVTFNFKKWYSWTKYHHKHNISPYYGHHLSSIAKIWEYHLKQCNSVIHQYWYDRRQKLTIQNFQDCKIYQWNKTGYRPKIAHHKHVR